MGVYLEESERKTICHSKFSECNFYDMDRCDFCHQSLSIFLLLLGIEDKNIESNLFQCAFNLAQT